MSEQQIHTAAEEEQLTPAEIEAGRVLFAQKCEFEWGVDQLSQLPPVGLTEIAFVGRSNVGKSSLVNALTGRKTLARTSNTPGRTQQLNFFNLGDRLRLVDLPGYGYAKVSKQKIAAWTKDLKSYLKGRVTLARALVLVDGRHGLKESDLEIMRMMDDAAVPYRVVLTKCDKVKKADLPKLVQKVSEKLKKHPAAFPLPYVTSSEKNIGISALRASITKIK